MQKIFLDKCAYACYSLTQRDAKAHLKGGENMYANLKAAMAVKGVSIDTLANLLKIHRNTISNKLDGDNEFTYGQAEMIQETMFPEYNARYLFHRDIPAAAVAPYPHA